MKKKAKKIEKKKEVARKQEELKQEILKKLTELKKLIAGDGISL